MNCCFQLNLIVQYHPLQSTIGSKMIIEKFHSYLSPLPFHRRVWIFTGNCRILMMFSVKWLWSLWNHYNLLHILPVDVVLLILQCFIRVVINYLGSSVHQFILPSLRLGRFYCSSLASCGEPHYNIIVHSMPFHFKRRSLKTIIYWILTANDCL